MNIVRRNIFAPKAAPANDLMVSRTGMDIAAIVTQASQGGGWMTGWRVSRAANGHSVELVRHALEAYFAARREELTFRVALELGTVKKRALAANYVDTAIVEREVTRMTATADDELTKFALDIANEAALEETRRVRDLEAELQRGDITQKRFERMCESIEKRTSDVSDRAQRVADWVIENIGERLEAALRNPEPPHR